MSTRRARAACCGGSKAVAHGDDDMKERTVTPEGTARDDGLDLAE